MIMSAKRNGANYMFAPFLLVLAFANHIFANDIHNFAFSRILLDFANRKFANNIYIVAVSRILLDFANCVFAFIIETWVSTRGCTTTHPLVFIVHCSRF